MILLVCQFEIMLLGKSCPWLEAHPIPKVILYRVFIWRKLISAIQGWPSFSPRASQLLTNHVKAFPLSCLGQASQSVSMGKSCLTSQGHATSQKGWPYPQGDPTTRVTLHPGWPYPQGDSTPGWPYPQGDLTPRVTLPQGDSTTRAKCEMCHI